MSSCSWIIVARVYQRRKESFFPLFGCFNSQNFERFYPYIQNNQTEKILKIVVMLLEKVVLLCFWLLLDSPEFN